MLRRVLALTLAATLGGGALMAQALVPTSSDAMLSACWEGRRYQTAAVDVFLEGADGGAALLMFSVARPGGDTLPDSFFEVVMPLDAAGAGHFGGLTPSGLVYDRDQPLWVTAIYRQEALIDGGLMVPEMAGLGRPGGLVQAPPVALMLGGSWEETLDFDWAPTATSLRGDDWFKD